MTMQKQEGTLYFKQCLVCLLNMTGLKWKGGKQGQYWATAFTLKAKCGICVCMPACLCVCACVCVCTHVHAHTHIHTYIYYCRTGKICSTNGHTNLPVLPENPFPSMSTLMPFNGTTSPPWAVWGPILPREKQCQGPTSDPWRFAPAPSTCSKGQNPLW